MYKILGLATIAALLAACNERPGLDDTTAVVTPTTVDEVIEIELPDIPGDGDDPDTPQEPIIIRVDGQTLTVGGINAAEFDGTVLRVNIPLDGTNGLAAYDPEGAVPNTRYQRFTTQRTELNRFFTALAAESDGGEVFAVVALDGGQFNSFLGGATVVQTAFDAPQNTDVSYEGDYVGLLNIPLTVLPGQTTVSPSFFPAEGTQITGRVFINASFGPSRLIEGGISDRSFVLVDEEQNPTTVTLGDLVLARTSVSETGLFGGAVQQIRIAGSNPVVGSFSGAFGGDDAAFVAGTTSFGSGILFQSDPENIDQNIQDLIDAPGSNTLQEYGIFVLDACPGGDCILSQPN